MAVTAGTHRKDQILEVAARLFSHSGYNGTSMQRLAEGLGILRGSIYAHISSKEDLLFEIVEGGADRFLERMSRVIGSDEPATTKLRSAFVAHIETVSEHLDAATVFLNDCRFLTGRRRRVIEEKRSRYEQMIRSLISQGVDEGVLDARTDPKFAALLILSSMNWLYQWYDPKGKQTPQQIADQFSEMILNGLASGRPKTDGRKP